MNIVRFWLVWNKTRPNILNLEKVYLQSYSHSIWPVKNWEFDSISGQSLNKIHVFPRVAAYENQEQSSVDLHFDQQPTLSSEAVKCNCWPYINDELYQIFHGRKNLGQELGTYLTYSRNIALLRSLARDCKNKSWY